MNASVDLLAAAVPGIRRPRLRADHPLAWRAGDRLQVGIGASAVQLSSASTDLARWLIAIDGTLDWAQVDSARTAHGISLDIACRSLTHLRRGGAFDDAGAMPDALRWATRETREAVESDLAAAGFSYGDALSANLVMERRVTTRVAVLGSGPLAEALRTAFDDSGIGRGAEGDADVHVLVEHRHPLLVDDADSWDGPHLSVGLFGDLGRIGPLVIPGVSSCLRCAHLHRRDADPEWPIVSLQFASALTRVRVHPSDRLLCRLTAVQAALLIRRWVDDPHAVSAWADTVLEVHLPDGELVREVAPPHPLCGCRWPG